MIELNETALHAVAEVTIEFFEVKVEEGVMIEFIDVKGLSLLECLKKCVPRGFQ